MNQCMLILSLAAGALAAPLLAGCQPSRGETAALPTLFVDERGSSGVDFRTAHAKEGLTILETTGHGAGLCDFDDDGNLDLVLVGQDQMRLYRGDGKFRFTDVTAQSGLISKGHWLGVATGDYDGDGVVDLFLSGYNCSALYQGQGGMRFRDRTAGSGLEVLPASAGKSPEWRSSAAFVDVDHDGLLDLYVTRYAHFGQHTPQLCEDKGVNNACDPQVYDSQRGTLFHNLGNGKFADETKARGLDVASGHGLGIACADFDDDGWIDIAVANDERPGDLFRNRGKGRFEQRGPQSGTAYDAYGHVHAGMGLDWADYDHDGWMDLFITTFRGEEKNLYRNLGTGVFQDMSLRTGLSQPLQPWISWGCRFLDYDNDTWADLLVASGHVQDQVKKLDSTTDYPQPLILMRNEAARSFTNVSAQAGPAFQTPWVGRAVCTGDIDNDGGVDAVVTNAEGHPLLLRNTASARGRWLSIRLEQPGKNRWGIGARITVKTRGGQQTSHVSASGSYLAANDVRAHFGLGAEPQAETVTVRWPDRRTERFGPLAAGRQVTLKYGAGAPVP